MDWSIQPLIRQVSPLPKILSVKFLSSYVGLKDYRDVFLLIHVWISAGFIFFFLERISVTAISTSFPSCVSILTVADCFFFLLENFKHAGTANKEEMPTLHARNFFLDTFLFSVSIN